MRWNLFHLFAAALMLGSSGVAMAQAQPTYTGGVTEGVKTIKPGFAPANDPWPGRAAVRTGGATVAANDNVLRGVGRSAAGLNDELKLVMSAEQANLRTAKYMRGVGAALAEGGSSRYLSRLGAIGKLANAALILYTAYEIGREFTGTEAAGQLVGTQGAYVYGGAGGNKSFSPALYANDFYLKWSPGTGLSAYRGNVDYPVGKYFLTWADRHLALVIVSFTTKTAYEFVDINDFDGTDAAGRQYDEWSSTFKDPDNKWMEIKVRQWGFYNGSNNTWFSRDDTYVPYGYGWIRPLVPAGTPVVSPDIKPLPAVSPAVVPPDEVTAPVTPQTFEEPVKRGLAAAGVEATPALVNKLSNAAAAGVQAGDLNATAPASVGTAPGATPIGDYVPQSVVDAANNPATDTATDPAPDPDPNPDPGTGGSEGGDSELQIEEGEPFVLPDISVGAFTSPGGQCPHWYVPFRDQTFDINPMCDKFEEYEPFLRPVFFVMALLIGFVAFRRG